MVTAGHSPPAVSTLVTWNETTPRFTPLKFTVLGSPATTRSLSYTTAQTVRPINWVNPAARNGTTFGTAPRSDVRLPSSSGDPRPGPASRKFCRPSSTPGSLAQVEGALLIANQRRTVIDGRLVDQQQHRRRHIRRLRERPRGKAAEGRGKGDGEHEAMRQFHDVLVSLPSAFQIDPISSPGGPEGPHYFLE